jgi:uncharacterized protein YggU (UPF0235/DUF167 family)
MYIHIKALTNQKEDRISERKPGYFEVLVREKPEQNQANRKIIQILAEYFKIKPEKVRMISGHHKPSKIFDINLS